MSKQKMRVVAMVLAFVMMFTVASPLQLVMAEPGTLSFDIFNNGPGGSPSRPNPGLAAAGIIRMWTQLDGVSTPVYIAAADTITAVNQNGSCAEMFVNVGQMWQAGQGWLPYFNRIDVNKNPQWQHINFSITVHGQTVELLLVNGNYTPASGYRTVTFTVEPGAVGVYLPPGTTTTLEVPHGTVIPPDNIPSTAVRQGFYFAGWYPGNPAQHGNVYEDLTFTARINPLFHYVTFKAGYGGEEIPLNQWSNPVRVRDGWVASASSIPHPQALTGFRFVEWQVEGTDEAVEPAAFTILDNTTFTAVFEPENIGPTRPDTGNPLVTITADRNNPLFEANFTFGVTHTHNHWYRGHPDAVQRAVDVLNKVSTIDNHHIMGWGPINPWPDPNGPMNFNSLRSRDPILERLSGNVWLTLCTAPGWMKCRNTAHFDPVNPLPWPAPCCVAADWQMEWEPRPEHYDAFAELVVAIVYEFPEVTTFQVWNELKGFWHNSTKYPDRPYGWWDYIEYTIFYNIVYDAMRATSRGNELRIGGLYIILEGEGTYEAFGWTGAHSYTTLRPDIGHWPHPQRQVNAIKYFLENARGMDYFLIDRGLVNFHRTSDPASAELLRLTTNYRVSMEEVVYLLNDSRFAHVPIMWSEFYGDSEILRDNAFRNRNGRTDAELWDYIRGQVGALYASIYYNMIMGAMGHNTQALLWMEPELGIHGIPHVLFTDTNSSIGGMPTPHFYSLYRLLKHFPMGTMLFPVEVDSNYKEYFAPFFGLQHSIEVLASGDVYYVINKTGIDVDLFINGAYFTLEAYDVRVFPPELDIVPDAPELPPVQNPITPGEGIELTIYGNPRANVNHAWGVGVTTTESTWAGSGNDGCAAFIIDGNPNTVWRAGTSAVPQWATIDLGRPKPVSRFVIMHNMWSWGNAGSYANRNFMIQGSNDGIEFRNLVSVIDNTSRKSAFNLTEPVTYRFFRLYVTLSHPEFGVHVNSFELWGYGPDGPCPIPPPPENIENLLTRVFAGWPGAAVATASSQSGANAPGQAIDGITTPGNGWVSANRYVAGTANNGRPEWLQIRMRHEARITEVKLTHSTNQNHNARSYTIFGGNEPLLEDLSNLGQFTKLGSIAHLEPGAPAGAVDTITVANEDTFRFIVYFVTEVNTATANARLVEIELFGEFDLDSDFDDFGDPDPGDCPDPVPTGTNVVLELPNSAFTASSTQESRRAPHMVRNGADIGWHSAAAGRGDAFNQTEWLRVDLGEPITITGVRIHIPIPGVPGDQMPPQTRGVRHYVILASNDGNLIPSTAALDNFTVLAEFESATDPEWLSRTHIVDVPGQYRYVWYFVLRPASNNQRARLQQIEIFSPEYVPSGFRFNVFYGLLHSHTGLSDGAASGTPMQAYQHARDVAGLDFYAVTEHNNHMRRFTGINAPDVFMTEEDYAMVRYAANYHYRPGEFVTFTGFEWTTWYAGHITVISNPNNEHPESQFVYRNIPGTIDFSRNFLAERNNASSMDNLYDWLEEREVVAFFNHPGGYNGTTRRQGPNNVREFNHFQGRITDRMVGMELFNRNFGFEFYYYVRNHTTHLRGTPGWGSLQPLNQGFSPNYRNFFNEALMNGWRIGAAGADDHHGTTWGEIDFRLAVLAEELTRDSIFEALQERRFFSTEDKNIRLSFTMGGHEMGSLVQPGTFNLVIHADDADAEMFTRARIIRNMDMIYYWTFLEQDLRIVKSIEANEGDYFYVVVTQEDGDQAISSPIWITADGLAPIPSNEPEFFPDHVDLIDVTGYVNFALADNNGTAVTNDPSPARPASAVIDGNRSANTGFSSGLQPSAALPLTLTVSLYQDEDVHYVKLFLNRSALIRDFVLKASNYTCFAAYNTLLTVTDNTNAVVIHNLNPNANYKYFKVSVTRGAETDGLVRVEQFEVYGIPRPDPGLGFGPGMPLTDERDPRATVNRTQAPGVTTNQSSHVGTHGSMEGPASNLIDGRPQSVWQSASIIMPQWAYVNLGEPMSVSTFVIEHNNWTWNPSVLYNSAAFRIQGSNTGEYGDFTNIVIVEGNTDRRNEFHLAEPVTFQFYRIFITESHPRYGAHVATFELWGQGEVTVTPGAAQEQADKLTVASVGNVVVPLGADIAQFEAAVAGRASLAAGFDNVFFDVVFQAAGPIDNIVNNVGMHTLDGTFTVTHQDDPAEIGTVTLSGISIQVTNDLTAALRARVEAANDPFTALDAARASSVHENGNHPAFLAIDGVSYIDIVNGRHGWASLGRYNAQTGMPNTPGVHEWLRINLGSAATITTIRILHGTIAQNSREYLVLGSNTDIPPTLATLGYFTELGHFSSDVSYGSNIVVGSNTFVINSAEAYQYIWFYILRGPGSGGSRARFIEIEVYGSY